MRLFCVLKSYISVLVFLKVIITTIQASTGKQDEVITGKLLAKQKEEINVSLSSKKLPKSIPRLVCNRTILQKSPPRKLIKHNYQHEIAQNDAGFFICPS